MTIIIDTFEDFVSGVVSFWYAAPADWRWGQTAFNLLVKVRPGVAEMVRGSDFDPFHNDSNLPEFYEYVMRNWNVAD